MPRARGPYTKRYVYHLVRNYNIIVWQRPENFLSSAIIILLPFASSGPSTILPPCYYIFLLETIMSMRAPPNGMRCAGTYLGFYGPLELPSFPEGFRTVRDARLFLHTASSRARVSPCGNNFVVSTRESQRVPQPSVVRSTHCFNRTNRVHFESNPPLIAFRCTGESKTVSVTRCQYTRGCKRWMPTPSTDGCQFDGGKKKKLLRLTAGVRRYWFALFTAFICVGSSEFM